MIELGRNDLCHCGSGKKYKKCHLEADQRHRAASRPRQPEPALRSAFADVTNLPKLLRRFAEHDPAGDRKEFCELLSKTEPVIEYLAHQSEIEAATASLEAHRSEFEKVALDEARYVALAHSLFSEECFAPLRFSVPDIQNAFENVGYPAMISPDDRTVQTLRAAILHLADKRRRSELSMRLLLRLPEFVAAGRYPEAWLIQSAALQTTEDGDESNAFLFEMFSYGYDAWAADRQAKDASLLREVGLDLDALKSMSLDELDSWMHSQGSDAANVRAMEEFFQKNPHVREESIANLQAMERNAPKLLEREDARFLFLRAEEIQPWLTRFNERLAERGFAAETPSEESAHKLFNELVLPLMREMAVAIFTPQRIRQLIAALRNYRSGLFPAEDKTTAGQVMGAINYLEREDSPGENSFLVTLCWMSLDSALKEMTAGSG